MDPLHVPGATQTASAAVSVRLSSGSATPFGPVVPFAYRVWWYDVHQVEGAV
jgi:hypothetical protein